MTCCRSLTIYRNTVALSAERANAIPVALMSGEQLVSLLSEHNIGIRRAKYDLLQLDEFESSYDAETTE